jgi:hypothetical protein
VHLALLFPSSNSATTFVGSSTPSRGDPGRVDSLRALGRPAGPAQPAGRYAAGTMFWFTRKTLSGSYSALTVWSRG